MAETNRRKSSCSLGFFWKKKAKSNKFLRVTKFFIDSIPEIWKTSAPTTEKNLKFYYLY